MTICGVIFICSKRTYITYNWYKYSSKGKVTCCISRFKNSVLLPNDTDFLYPRNKLINAFIPSQLKSGPAISLVTLVCRIEDVISTGFRYEIGERAFFLWWMIQEARSASRRFSMRDDFSLSRFSLIAFPFIYVAVPTSVPAFRVTRKERQNVESSFPHDDIRLFPIVRTAIYVTTTSSAVAIEIPSHDSASCNNAREFQVSIYIYQCGRT